MKVFVGEGVSEGALVKVGITVAVGNSTKVCVAAAPAVSAIIVLTCKRSKVGGAYGVASGAHASSNTVIKSIASVR